MNIKSLEGEISLRDILLLIPSREWQLDNYLNLFTFFGLGLVENDLRRIVQVLGGNLAYTTCELTWT